MKKYYILIVVLCLIIIGEGVVIFLNSNQEVKPEESYTNIPKEEENVENKEEATMVVYIEETTSDERILEMENEIRNISTVSNVEFMSREEWMEEMQNYSDTLDAVFEYLDNPSLLDSFIVTVNDINEIDNTAQLIEDISNVSEVQYSNRVDSDVIENDNNT